MDRVLKELTELPAVVDIIVKAVTNKKAVYEAKAVNWDDGTRSELVLLPKKDGAFIEKQEAIGLKASEKFGIEPYFLIICTGKLESSLSVKRSRNNPCLDFPCGAWATKCLIMTNSSADDHIQGVDTSDELGYYGRVCELNPFIAYAIFIHGHTEEVLGKSEDNDPTLEFLYGMTQHLRRKHLGAESVDNPPRTIENPINKFYEKFEQSVNDIKTGYYFEDYYEGIVEDFVGRERKKMVSNKRYKKIVKEYEDSFGEDDW